MRNSRFVIAPGIVGLFALHVWAYIPASSSLMTVWGEKMSPDNAWREYPRPQMVRDRWVNLNGEWTYAVSSITNSPGRPTKWQGKILVPFAIESALSGVGRELGPDEFLWYTKSIRCEKRKGERILLHFGAVDFRTMVFIGHNEVTDVPHEGGNLPWTLDITDFVVDGENELTVCVWDPTGTFVDSPGKQRLKGGDIFYTRVSGIWQTVWMEYVPDAYIRGYRIYPDIDRGEVGFEFDIGDANPVRLTVKAGDGQSGPYADADGRIELQADLPANFMCWSPEHPKLYDFTAKFGRDVIRGYFGMRKIEKRADANGVLRFFLNNEPYFILGTLDQGWWPDGLLTPPSEEAMTSDIVMLKSFGFNALRKHIKVEPLRYYAACDRIGILVVQDLPSGADWSRSPKIPETVKRYHFSRAEQKGLMDVLQTIPSIVMWCPYNEGWAQPGEFLTHSMLDFVRRHDRTRLVNGPSGAWDWEGGHILPNGWEDWERRSVTSHKPVGVCEAGDTVDAHVYRGPNMLPVNNRRISFLGEFGGLGHQVPGHVWKKNGSWGYGGTSDTKTSASLERTYLDLMERVKLLADRGLGGAIYTQTSDVELETNGLVTYDRRVEKFDRAVLSRAHRAIVRQAESAATVKRRPVTTGWENVSPQRDESVPGKVIWSAPEAGFIVEKSEGAKGEVAISGGRIRIRKTNGAGRILVVAPSFKADKGVALRFHADVSTISDEPASTVGYLCAWSGPRKVEWRDEIAEQWFSGGGNYMKRLINSAPGMTYRKYRHLRPEWDEATVAIVVEGPASESEWSNLTAEDLDSAQAAWDRRFARLSSPDRSGDRQPLAEFEKSLAADVDHSANVTIENGFSKLKVDGAVVNPILYKAPGCEWDVKDRLTYSGKPLQEAGVRIGVVNLRLGNLPSMSGPWSERGFDVTAAVETVRNEMRIGDKSLFLLALGTSAYPKFSEDHPDETWRNEDGSVVRGNSGSAIPDVYNDGGKPDPGDVRWPWMSYASPAWRTAIKSLTAELFSELRRTGLMKRIIGVHFYGYHDGQFAVPIADYSPCAKADYARYLLENGLKKGDPGAGYDYFMKQLGFRALEDFSREAKRLAGKPIVAARWIMSPFFMSFDVTSFVRSDAVDIIVPQPAYDKRMPGQSQGVRMPVDSLHRHGKLMLFEFDLRTYAALDGWAQSVVAARGLGQADDLAMWQTIFRKHAGIMNAQRMGWWFYDMAGGWYYPREIVTDVKGVVDCRSALERNHPDPWHPDLAIVIDEAAIGSYNGKDGPKVRDPMTLVNMQWTQCAQSGVPYAAYLASDFYDDPQLASKYKALVLAGFVVPDARQRKLMNALERAGVKTFVAQPGGYSPQRLNAFAREAGCQVVTDAGHSQVDINGNFLSVHCLVPGKHRYRIPFPARVVNLKSGADEHVEENVLTLNMTAGETCWFGIERQ